MKLSLMRIVAIARKEMIYLRRDRLTGGLIAGIPIVMTILFGYAINSEVRGLSAGIVDEANTSASRELIKQIRASQVIDRLIPLEGTYQIQSEIVAGRISIGIYIPQDFERRLSRGERPLAQLMVDDSDPTLLSTVKGLARLPFLSPGDEATDMLQIREPFEIRAMFNPERRSSLFIVPGLCGVILTLTMVLFTSIAIVREKEHGNMELLIATPILSIELMIGKILPYVVIGYIQVTLILLLGSIVFEVPIRGSLIDFYISVGIFVFSVLTLGLVISTFAKSQFQAFQMTFMTYLPQLLLSGFMFPFEGMPVPAQWLSELFPITHYLRIVRGVVLRDAELVQLYSDIWPLFVFFLVFLVIATLRFQKRLD